MPFQAPVVLHQEPLDGFLRQLRVVGWQAPVDVEVAVGIDRNDAFHTARAAECDAPLCEVNLRFGQIKTQSLGGQDDAHLPQSFLREGLRLARHAWRQLVAGKVGQIKIARLVERHLDVVGARTRQNQLAGFHSGQAQVNAVFRIRLELPKSKMPFSADPKRLRAAQFAIERILMRRDVAQSQRVGHESQRRSQVLRNGEDDIASVLQLKGEEIIRFQETIVSHTYRGMIRAQPIEDHVEGDCPGALRCEFL